MRVREGVQLQFTYVIRFEIRESFASSPSPISSNALAQALILTLDLTLAQALDQALDLALDLTLDLTIIIIIPASGGIEAELLHSNLIPPIHHPTRLAMSPTYKIALIQLHPKVNLLPSHCQPTSA